LFAKSLAKEEEKEKNIFIKSKLSMRGYPRIEPALKNKVRIA